MGLEFTDRIRLWIDGSEAALAALRKHQDLLASEVLAVEVVFGETEPGVELREVEVEGEKLTLGIRKV